MGAQFCVILLQNCQWFQYQRKNHFCQQFQLIVSVNQFLQHFSHLQSFNLSLIPHSDWHNPFCSTSQLIFFQSYPMIFIYPLHPWKILYILLIRFISTFLLIDKFCSKLEVFNSNLEKQASLVNLNSFIQFFSYNNFNFSNMETKLRGFKQFSALSYNSIDKQYSDISFFEENNKKVKKNDTNGKSLRYNPYEQIPFLPQIQLSKDDMKEDPIPLLLKLQQQFKDYGAVKLRSCPQWKPSFNFKYTDKGITTRIQKIHKLKKGKAFQEIQGAYSVKAFEEFALKTQRDYKFKFQRQGSTVEAQIENQYWNMVEGVPSNQQNAAKYKMTVQYAADLPVTKHGSGFPTFETKGSQDQNFNYKESLFNLNNVYKSPKSILTIAEEKREFISGITIPWVYMGMMFSTFCWHVEDLWLNSINYSHKGGIKTWYVIPASDKEKFDQFVANKTNDPEFLDRITFMLNPLEIKKAGIRIYKTYQRPGDYICTFFKAYHAGFSQGFNVGEAVNFVCPQSLNMIKEAQQTYVKKNQKKPSVISLEWLVHENYRKKKENSPGVIKKEFEQILQSELKYLKSVITKFKIKEILELGDQFKYDKNSCSVCRNYLYLSSLKCPNCQKNYCQTHLHDCCGKGFQLIIRTPFGKRKKNIESIENLL